MKRFYFGSLLFLLSFAVIAQEPVSSTSTKFTSKKGAVIHPEKGDWCIGISATPFLNYLGNVFNLNGGINNSPSFGFTAQNPSTIWGKYMISETQAYRVSATIGFSRSLDKEPNAMNDNNTDKYTTSAISFGVTAGIENYRPVRNRLVGFYGVEGGFSFSPYYGRSRNGNLVNGRYTFENATNPNNGFTESGGNTISVVGQGFIGVEYFFAPKMSLSGEFDLGVRFSTMTERVYNPKIGNNEVIDAGSSSVDLSPSASGGLALRFFF